MTSVMQFVIHVVQTILYPLFSVWNADLAYRLIMNRYSKCLFQKIPISDRLSIGQTVLNMSSLQISIISIHNITDSRTYTQSCISGLYREFGFILLFPLIILRDDCREELDDFEF